MTGVLQSCSNSGGRALAVFSGGADRFWQRLLRPGFRHCFVALEEAGNWVTVDPLAGYTDVAVQPVPAGFDLAGFYRERGFTVVETRRRRRHRPVPPLPATCVEVAKRVLGIAAWRVLTPGQLHDFLLRDEKSFRPGLTGRKQPLNWGGTKEEFK